MKKATPLCAALSLVAKQIHHYEADGTHKRMKYKSLPTAGKRSDTPLFWDSQGSILEALSEMGVTINNSRYSEILS
jgi:hypothetical protein